MYCYVYKSVRKPGAYAYLARRDEFDVLPAAARAVLGQLAFVMELELTPQRRLARAAASEVMSSLAAHGFFIQMPPQDPAAAALAGSAQG